MFGPIGRAVIDDSVDSSRGGKLTLEAPIQVISTKASDLANHTIDVINIRFTLVYEGVNNNNDMFTASELKRSYKTLIHKAINWEHTDENIGVITEASYIPRTDSTPAHIQCEGTIWAWKYPDRAEAIIKAAELGEMGLGEGAELGMSMECFFKDYEFVVIDDGKSIARKLKDVVFGGAGVVASPAEKKARLLAVASNRSMLIKGKELFAELPDSSFALPSLRMFPIDSREHTLSSLDYFGEVASLLEDEISNAQIIEAHSRLISSARSFGLHEVDSHSCFVCESEGGLGDMGKKKKIANASEDDTLAADDVLDPEDSAEAEDSASESGDTPDGAEPAVDESEAGADDGGTEEPEGVESEFDFKAAFESLMEKPGFETLLEDALKAIVAAYSNNEEDESSASEDGDGVDEAGDELAAANERIKELEKELDDARAELRGHLRIQELVSAGLEIPEDKLEEKMSFLASLDDSAWATYRDDVIAAMESSASKVDEEDDGSDVDSAVASLNLEDEPSTESNDRLNAYSMFWK